MTKSDMVDAVAKSAGITKKAAGSALEALRGDQDPGDEGRGF